VTIELLYGRGRVRLDLRHHAPRTQRPVLARADPHAPRRGRAARARHSKHYVEAQRRLVELGSDGFGASIAGKPHADIDEWQTQMQLRPMRVGRVHLYTDGLSEEDAALTGVDRVTDVTSAIAESMARHADPHVAFVPEGPYVVPLHGHAVEMP
jgi:hypothetical protein